MRQLSDKLREKPIGVFDSGIGGLTVVKAMKSILPKEDIMYFGDTKRVPYGGKDKETIMKYARQDIAFLNSMGVKTVIAACGTVSSYLEEIGLKTDVTGVVNPTCLAAVNATKNGKIGVIGTAAAVNSKSYKQCIANLNSKLKVYQQECSLLVPLIENGCIDDSSADLKRAVEMYTKPFIENEIDTLILGCTHYPIIKSVIQKIIGKEVILVDSGEETAKFVKSILKKKKLDSQRATPGKQNFFVSGDIQKFSNTAKMFLGYDIYENVNKIDVDSC